jgi:hypothetical protein
MRARSAARDTAREIFVTSTVNEPVVARALGLWDAVSIIIGIVIGAGIYETAPLVFSNVSSSAAALGVWVAGGLLSLIGAACYAELASTYPRSGGDYVYLTRAFGPFYGFLFGWAQLSVVLTGSIGMMAFVFADYAVGLSSGAPTGAAAVWAAAVVIALTMLHVASVSLGTRAQNVLTWTKVVGVSTVVLVGAALTLGRAEWPTTPSITAGRQGSWGLAMILVLYTFGGWNDAAFVASEVRDRERNLPRALLGGTLGVTLVYLAMNAAFLGALGFDDAQRSKAIARDVFVRAFGAWGGVAISLLVMISALGAVNALIFTGSRVHAALGRDYSALGRLAFWHPRLRSPVTSRRAAVDHSAHDSVRRNRTWATRHRRCAREHGFGAGNLVRARRFRHPAQLHGARVLVVLSAHGLVAVSVAPLGAAARAPIPRAALSTDTRRVLRDLCVHAVCVDQLCRKAGALRCAAARPRPTSLLRVPATPAPRSPKARARGERREMISGEKI